MFNTRLRGLFLLLLICFWGLAGPACAQTDPQGLECAQKLKAFIEAKDSDGFTKQVSSDPTLTVRAFLASIEKGLLALKAGDNEEGSEGFYLAALAAKGLELVNGDKEPNTILKAFEKEDPQALQKFLDYAANYPGDYKSSLQKVAAWLQADFANRPQQAPPRDVEADYSRLRVAPGTLSPEYLAAIKPYLVGLQRIAITSAFAAPNLTIQELDRFAELSSKVEAEVKKLGPDDRAKFQKEFAYVKPRLSILKLRILAEVGLLGEFNTEIGPLLSSDTDLNDKLDLLYAGFRMAWRQQLWNAAQAYLDKMESFIQQDPDGVSPAFGYVLATGKVQLRWARGEEFSTAQWLDDFNEAWSHLQGYRPIVRVGDDITWHLTRSASHFWVDRLSELPDADSAAPILRMTKDCETWVNGTTAFEKTLDTLTDDMSMFYGEQLQGYLTVALSNMDTLIYVVEKWKPIRHDAQNFASVSDSFPDSLKQIRDGANQLAGGIANEQFPPLRLEESALLTELQARSLYLQAIAPSNSPEERIAKLQKAQAGFDKVDVPESFIDYHLLLGHQFQDAGRPKLAIECWKQAFQRAKERSFVERAVEAATLLARQQGQSGMWEDAQSTATQATALIQQGLDGNQSAAGKELTKLNSELAEIQTKAAIESDKPELALAAITRDREVQSAAAQLEANPEAAQASRELNTKRQQMALLSDKVRELSGLPESSTRDQLLEKTQTLLAQTKSEFLLQSRNIRQKFAKLYATALRFDPLNLPDVQQALTDKTAVVQYFPTEDQLFVFVVTKDRFRLRSVQQRKDELEGLVQAYLRDLRVPGRASAPMKERSRKLYDILIQPVEADLADSQTLVLIPSGQLNFLPFAPLMAPDGHYLLEKKVLLELAKPTDFLRIATSTPKPPTHVVAFANSTLDLPAAEEEGKSITAMFPGSKLFVEKQANKENLFKYGSEAEILHFATHGVWDSTDSTKNHLELANGQELAQEEIFEMGLDGTSIVTLSACNTAMGETVADKYVASLAEAFWIAGCRTVVASLWQVEDTSTGLLMTQFYEKLKEGKPKGEALREAQMAVLHQEKYAHPYFWSGFSMFGDYR